MAVGSPNSVGSLTPYARPVADCTFPQRRPPLHILPRAQRLARVIPAVPPPVQLPFSLIGFSVNKNAVWEKRAFSSPFISLPFEVPVSLRHPPRAIAAPSRMTAGNLWLERLCIFNFRF